MKDTEHAVFLVYYTAKGATVQGQRRQNRMKLYSNTNVLVLIHFLE